MALHTVCQLEIDQLLAELSEANDALIAARQDAEAYRLLSQVALQKNAELTIHNDRLRVCLQRSLGDRYGVTEPDAFRQRAAA
jgi:hypothetical protein